MDAETEKRTDTPWYARAKTLVISAGALAGAIVAVLGLWDRFVPPDVEDVAKIEMVEVVRQSALSDFVTANLGTGLPLEAAPEAAVLRRAMATGPASPGLPGAETPQPAPDGIPPSAPESSAPGSASPPAATSTTTAAPPPEEPPEAVTGMSTWRSAEENQNIVTQEAVIQYGLVSADVNVFPPGSEDPAEAAAQIAEALSVVEGSDSPAPEPRGWIVAVDLSLEGLAGEPFILTWSLDGVDVPQSWASESLAYRVEASTNRDAGTAEIWVPDLAMPGTYKVNVKLVYESDGTAAARGASSPLPGP